MRLQELQESAGYPVFLDLDGVLANFDKKVEEITGKPIHKLSNNKMWDAVKEHVKAGNEFWGDLELMPDALDLWDYVKPHSPEILTASGDMSNSEPEKRRWVAEMFGPDVPVHVVHKSKDKAQFADENHILIDDRSKSIKPWEQKGGTGVLHQSAAQTVQKLKDLGI